MGSCSIPVSEARRAKLPSQQISVMDFGKLLVGTCKHDFASQHSKLDMIDMRILVEPRLRVRSMAHQPVKL